ncbi:GntR family transcriptional regulator, partial [Streptomyces sp. NRRL WC-3753]
MYAVDPPAAPAESWAEHGAIVDAVARGDAERARALTAQHAERATAVHRLRFGSRTTEVRTSQHAVNIPGGRN